VGHDYYLAMYLNLWSYVSNYVASTKQTRFVIFYLTPMDVIRMPLVKMLCWINTILACLLKVVWNPLRFLDYQDYESLSIGIWWLQWLFLYLCSYNLVGSITPLPFLPRGPAMAPPTLMRIPWDELHHDLVAKVGDLLPCPEDHRRAS
jgi:hypothetical protein